MNDYKRQLWDEIARNDPIMAKAIKATKPFNPTLNKFRWRKPPAIVLCVYARRGW